MLWANTESFNLILVFFYFLFHIEIWLFPPLQHLILQFQFTTTTFTDTFCSFSRNSVYNKAFKFWFWCLSCDETECLDRRTFYSELPESKLCLGFVLLLLAACSSQTAGKYGGQADSCFSFPRATESAYTVHISPGLWKQQLIFSLTCSDLTFTLLCLSFLWGCYMWMVRFQHFQPCPGNSIFFKTHQLCSRYPCPPDYQTPSPWKGEVLRNAASSFFYF